MDENKFQHLLDLRNLGFKKIEPLTSFNRERKLSQFPNIETLLNEEESKECSEKYNDHVVRFLDDHPDFWDDNERLREESWRFVNYAALMGKTRFNGETLYLHGFETDSEAVYKLTCKLLEELKTQTIIVKSRKSYGYHVYWFERMSHDNINLSHCKPRFEFEIKTKGQFTLPTSTHRDDNSFHYYFWSTADKIAIIDGFYDRLTTEVLKDSLADGWNKIKLTNVGENLIPNKDKMIALTEEQVDQTVART